MSLSPQCQTVLAHLQSEGSITPVEAQTVHKIRHLPRRIMDLKVRGWDIRSDMKTDVTGQRYVRYFLLGRLPDEESIMRILSRRVADDHANSMEYLGGREWCVPEDDGFDEIAIHICRETNTAQLNQNEDNIALTAPQIKSLIACLHSIEGKL